MALAVHSKPIGRRVCVHRKERSHPLQPRDRGRRLGVRRGRARSVCAIHEDRSADHPHGPVHEHMAGVTGGDGVARGHDRREQSTGGESSIAPTDLNSEVRRCLADGSLTHRRHPVDVRGLESGIGDGLTCGTGSQVDAGDAGPATDRRDADTGNDGTTLVFGHSSQASAVARLRYRGGRRPSCPDSTADHRGKPSVLDWWSRGRIADIAVPIMCTVGTPSE